MFCILIDCKMSRYDYIERHDLSRFHESKKLLASKRRRGEEVLRVSIAREDCFYIFVIAYICAIGCIVA